MQCSACGSQDTTPKSGITKTGKNAGKPWKAYDCNEPQCKNEKGYPTRTFVNIPKTQSSGGGSLGDLKEIVSKLDRCLAILEKNFGKVVIEKNEEEAPF